MAASWARFDSACFAPSRTFDDQVRENALERDHQRVSERRSGEEQCRQQDHRIDGCDGGATRSRFNHVLAKPIEETRDIHENR